MLNSARLAGALLALLAATAGAQQADVVRQYRFEAAEGGYRLARHDVPKPEAGPGQALVRVRAVSLSRRDIYMLTDQRNNFV